MRTANPGTIGTNDLHLAQVSTSTEDMKSRTLGSANPNRNRKKYLRHTRPESIKGQPKERPKRVANKSQKRDQKFL
jgi:hypothetical protein